MIYQFRPGGTGYGGNKKTKEVSINLERNLKWLTRNQ